MPQKLNRAQRRKYNMQEKQTFICANLVYGHLFPELWCNNHLKSLLDSTNLPALKEKYKLEYALITDDQTLMQISRHPNFMQLSAIAEIHIIKMSWPPDSDQFNSRYGLLADMLKQMMEVALTKEQETGQMPWMGCWVADLVFAKHSLPKMLKRLEAGHEAVFNVPIRSAADSINHILAALPGAPTDLELFEMAYRNLHHLWAHSHWDSPLFSKFPYSMLWNSGTGLVTHNFGITPIVFKPNAEMKAVSGGIDSDLPSFCKNPYWATDWLDAAVAGVEPLSNGHWPPFQNPHQGSSVGWVADWARKNTTPKQAEYLDKALYYPCKSVFNNAGIAAVAQDKAEQIQKLIKG